MLKRVSSLFTRSEYIFLLFVVVFGIVSILIMPIGLVPDEPTHFGNAFVIFHASPDLDFADFSKEMRFPKNQQNAQSLLSLFSEHLAPEHRFEYGFHLSISSIRYLPQAVGILFGQLLGGMSLGWMYLGGRLFNLAFYTIGIFFSVKHARFGRLPMVFIALLPMSIQQAGSLSYDVSLFVSVFLCFSLMTNLWLLEERLSMRWYLAIIGILILLYLSKESAVSMAAYLITIPTVVWCHRSRIARLVDKMWHVLYRVRYLVIAVIIGIFGFYLKYSFRSLGGGVRGFQILFNSLFNSQLNEQLDPVTTVGVFGSFGYFNYRLPVWVVLLTCVVLSALFLSEQTMILPRRVTGISWLIFLVNIVVTEVAMYTAFGAGNKSGQLWIYGVQGRYFTPFLLVFIPIAIGFKYHSKTVVQINERVRKTLLVSTTTFLLIFYCGLTVMYFYTPYNGATAFIDALSRL